MIRTLLLTSLVAGTALAQNAAPAAPAEAKKTVPPYELKNRSTYAIPRETRTPFWPIGWTRELTMVPTEGVKLTTPIAKTAFQIQPQHFSVTSILLGAPSFATINGRSFAQGETLPVFVGAAPLKVTVQAVRDGSVVLVQEGGQPIVVPLKRITVPARAQETTEPGAQFKIEIK